VARRLQRRVGVLGMDADALASRRLTPATHAGTLFAARDRNAQWTSGDGGCATPGTGGEGALPHRAAHHRLGTVQPLVACRALRGRGTACGPDRDRRTPPPAPTSDRPHRAAHGAGRSATRAPPSACPPHGDATSATRGRVGNGAGACPPRPRCCRSQGLPRRPTTPEGPAPPSPGDPRPPRSRCGCPPARGDGACRRGWDRRAVRP
jgi:hypothetical protein